jgi:TPR repeat protein
MFANITPGKSRRMKSLRGIAVLLICVVLIAAAAITWHFVEAKTTERKLAEDAKVCRVRAEQGDVTAQYELGRMYYQGKGVPQDYVEALRWYRKAADQGNAKGQYGVGFMYEEGKGVPQDYAQAIAWYRKAAGQGNEKAQYGLAYIYHEGKGVPRDPVVALDWFRKSADLGYGRAQYALGYTYYLGKEVPQDYATAVGWYRKSADQGDAEAQSDLGYMYAEGKGVPQDYTEAVRWYHKAADQGYARGQDGLGYAYSHGAGVPQNYAEAARWYRKAAKQGDEYARRALESMNIRLGATRKITLSVTFVFCLFLLISSNGSIRTRQQRRTTLPGLLGLTRVGLDVYGYSHFGIVLSLSAVNAFYFGKSLLGGIFLAMLVPIVWANGVKIVLRTCGILFIGFNIYAITHYDLRHLASCPRAFYSANGLLIGTVITSAMFLWLDREKTRGSQNGNDAVASGTVAGSRVDSLRM